MSLDLLQPITHKLEALNIKQTALLLHVSIPEQSLKLFRNGELIREFTVSTGLNPPSCLENSNGTPDGLHRIAEKIGHGAASGTVFKSRVDQGKLYWEMEDAEQKANLVTTRILWLDGLEPGHNSGGNRDTFNRYVYIHGTNHEERIGQPASGGCVVLRNDEMIELFDLVAVDDLVYISL